MSRKKSPKPTSAPRPLLEDLLEDLLAHLAQAQDPAQADRSRAAREAYLATQATIPFETLLSFDSAAIHPYAHYEVTLPAPILAALGPDPTVDLLDDLSDSLEDLLDLPDGWLIVSHLDPSSRRPVFLLLPPPAQNSPTASPPPAFI
jgi:hypothetical protein